jgi:MoaA/NifB/PqqE/SkfB family radical SAM enzyme
MQTFIFDIDIVGACNLRCPSCPQGNVADYRLPQGFMEPALLDRLLAKAQGECLVQQVNLFIWAEPLLHPRLPELVNIVQARGIPCHLSSNLNLLPDADAIMATNPASFKVSVSGFSQDVYGVSHRGGNIAKVKNHMQELAAAKQRTHASTRIYVNYHRYLHNLKEEPLMRAYAASLGFEFEPVWALLLPLEKILGFGGDEDFGFPLAEQDHRLIKQLALPFNVALEAARQVRDQPCRLRDNQLSIDWRGTVQLCCGIFDAGRFTLGKFLTLSLDEIQRLRYSHAMCARCMLLGGHVYLTYGMKGLAELAIANIPKEDVELLPLREELKQLRLKAFLQRVYQKLPADILSPGQKTALIAKISRTQRFFGRWK